MKLKKEFLTIFVIQITEVLGFSLILPFLPFYAEDLGASPFVVGLILTSFSLFQFVSAPIMGKLSDHYGRKPLLIFSQLSTFLSFIILGFAGSLKMIFLSRMVDGLLGSNFTIAQAYLSDISTKKERSRVFGISGMAFGLGFLIGPAIGGFLSQFSYSLPSFLAAGISFITILTTLIFLPETVKRKKETKLALEIFNLSQFKKYFSEQKIANKLWVFFTFILTHALWVSTFALYAKRQLNLDATHIGYLLAYIGLLTIILRGVLLGKIIDLFGENRLRITGAVLIIVGLMLSAFVTKWWMFLGVMTLFAVGTGLSRPLLIGSISRSVSGQEQGALLGVSNSLGSLSRIIGPLIGGFIINYFHPGVLGFISALVMTIGLILMLKTQDNSGFL